ncbi:hypothetical protein Q9R29_01615 [Rothia sp. ARF10]|nr:hypothetical protein [Rothia sp. ARF10]
MEGLTVDDEHVPYPESTPDFVKSARLLGLEVHFTEHRETRRYVGFKALEDWLPVLEVTRDLLVGVEGGLLVELLKVFLDRGATDVEPRLDTAPLEAPDDGAPTESRPPTPRTLLHVDWRVTDGERQSRFRADGDAESVLRALAEFERNLRDQ